MLGRGDHERDIKTCKKLNNKEETENTKYAKNMEKTKCT